MDLSLEHLSPTYEDHTKWIRNYKYICGILAILQVLAITFNMIKSLNLKDQDFYHTTYFVGNVVVFMMQVLIMFSQMKAIPKRDSELQEKIVFLCKVNVVIIPLWFGFGAIYCLRDLTIALEVGVTGTIISIIQLHLARQIKWIFDDKNDGSHFELVGSLFQL